MFPRGRVVPRDSSQSFDDAGDMPLAKPCWNRVSPSMHHSLGRNQGCCKSICHLREGFSCPGSWQQRCRRPPAGLLWVQSTPACLEASAREQHGLIARFLPTPGVQLLETKPRLRPLVAPWRAAHVPQLCPAAPAPAPSRPQHPWLRCPKAAPQSSAVARAGEISAGIAQVVLEPDTGSSPTEGRRCRVCGTARSDEISTSNGAARGGGGGMQLCQGNTAKIHSKPKVPSRKPNSL